jgi:hypothetical protein
MLCYFAFLHLAAIRELRLSAEMEKFPSYSPPDTLRSFTSINPRPLKALQTPLLPSVLPALPNPEYRVSTLPGYELTRHIIPAAFPRSACELQPSIPFEETPQERASRVAKMAQDMSLARFNIQRGLEHGKVQDTVLYNVFNRYTRREDSFRDGPGLTLLVLHANG